MSYFLIDVSQPPKTLPKATDLCSIKKQFSKMTNQNGDDNNNNKNNNSYNDNDDKVIDNLTQQIHDQLHLTSTSNIESITPHTASVAFGTDESTHDNTANVFKNTSSTLPTKQTAVESATPTVGPILMCDAGYGFPREARPRREKLLAIARQLVHFIQWQQQLQQQQSLPLSPLQVVACPNETIQQALEQRTCELLQTNTLPNHVTFSCQSLEDARHKVFLSLSPQEEEENNNKDNEYTSTTNHVVYLSPDAQEALSSVELPPRIIIVGLLIDRRVQLNRSLQRAQQAFTSEDSTTTTTTTTTTTINSSQNMGGVLTKRWPLKELGFVNIHGNEPLNVDCVLEGMQQWWWNILQQDKNNNNRKECLAKAIEQAIQHHANRHPSRPVHRTPTVL